MLFAKAGLLIIMGGCLKSELGFVGFLGWVGYGNDIGSCIYPYFLNNSMHRINPSLEIFLVIKLIRLTLPSQNQKVQNAYYTTIGKKRKRNH